MFRTEVVGFGGDEMRVVLKDGAVGVPAGLALSVTKLACQPFGEFTDVHRTVQREQCGC